MHYLVEQTEKEQKIYKTSVINPRMVNVLGSELALKIISELAKKPSCAMDVARRLNEHEQKIYYHLRRLEKAGIIKLVRREERVGALAKIYSVSNPYISVKLFEGKGLSNVNVKPSETEFLHPFIKDSKMNSIIVVGSPDPHGRFGYQASDGYAAIDLALFLGSFLRKGGMNYKLDTQIRERDLNQNLILIGGPKSNILVDKINKKLPIYFDEKNEWTIVSKLTNKIYTEDEIGVIVKMPSPFKKGKYILFASGRRFKGTRASIVAIVKHTKKLEKSTYTEGIAKVVKGIDRDADGMIDDVEFLE